jgi:hypothetical protein
VKITKPAEKISYSLPTEANEPSDSLSAYSILLYGPKKIGKTSLTARFEDAIFLACEPGTKALRVYTVPITKWEDFLGYLNLLESGKHKFKNVVVDTVDKAYLYAFDYQCRKQGIGHPSEENDYGATWKKISEIFEKAILRLLNIPGVGVVFTSHDVEKEMELRDGTKIDRVQPTMDRRAMQTIEAVVDIIISYQFKGEKRFFRIDGDQEMVAGCRIEEHFLRQGGKPGTAGDRIVTIPAGRSAEEAFDNLMSAFRNEQVDPDPANKKIEVKKKSFVIKK